MDSADGEAGALNNTESTQTNRGSSTSRWSGGRALLWFSLFAVFMLLVWDAAWLTPRDVLTWMLVPVLIGPALISVAWSLIYALVRFRGSGRRAVLPLAANLLAVALCVALWSHTDSLRWKWLEPDFARVAAMVETGELTADRPVGSGPQPMRLPSQYAHLSLGGIIVVYAPGEVLHIYFPTYAFGLDDDQGFIYTSDGLEPRPATGSYEPGRLWARRAAAKWFFGDAGW